ncbi:MAG: hypothetical protein J6C37_11190 [Roseburia sp.]|nr:hypothetical protein [Roseburia sp.]
MSKVEKWIWLDEKRYPQYQTTICSGCLPNKEDGNYTVAEFMKEYSFDNEVVKAELRFSGDTEFQLYLNKEILATGPISVGGDFLFNETPRSKHYSSELIIYPNTNKLHFFARVKMMPIGLNEYSRGRGGFMLWAKLRFKNGRIKYITTDSTWLAKRNNAYIKDCHYEQDLDTEDFSFAVEVPNIWYTETAPINVRSEKAIYPINNGRIILAPGERREVHVEFDKIYAGFIGINAKVQGHLDIKLDCIETEISICTYHVKFVRNGGFRGLQLRSIGSYRVCIENNSAQEAEAEFYMTATNYPVLMDANTYTNDEDLNLVLQVCKHTLNCCRQMIHLDSPLHSEPLACTGDYYIESLMTAMSFGDMSLAEFDVIRTAELLRVHNGRMFHTTYSLIWVMMLWDVYEITGNKDLLTECQDALSLLLELFETYIGENGLIETPPDYMFVDWIYIDGISMHHPPKALGQTSLCAFYYGALKAAEKIFAELNEETESDYCARKAENVREAVNKLLYDKEKGLYFDGLNTLTPKHLLGEWMPQNTRKRYYMPHSNILCACFGVCEDEIGRMLIKKVMEDKAWGVCQPYFKQYLLEAIYRLGLCQEYTLSVIEDWKEPVKSCPKGLVEGFIAPEPSYTFDHSHAWGGTPLYSLPKAILGLEILEPGYKKIRLSPTLLGLERAHIEVPTPYGMMVIDLEKGNKSRVNIPEGIEVIM